MSDCLILTDDFASKLSVTGSNETTYIFADGIFSLSAATKFSILSATSVPDLVP